MVKTSSKKKRIRIIQNKNLRMKIETILQFFSCRSTDNNIQAIYS